MSRPTAADRAAAARRRQPANKTTGCKPHDDVCLEHDLPLACEHGCEEALPHRCTTTVQLQHSYGTDGACSACNEPMFGRGCHLAGGAQARAATRLDTDFE